MLATQSDTLQDEWHAQLEIETSDVRLAPYQPSWGMIADNTIIIIIIHKYKNQ